MSRFILTILVVISFFHIKAQLNFTKSTSTYNVKGSWSGVAGGFCDVNGDLTDDLIILNKGKYLEIGYNKGVKNAVNWTEDIEVFQNSEYAVTVADLDNDFIPEIIVNGAYSGTKVYKRNTSGELYLHYTVPTLIYSQATNLVDIDNDGYLDLFICNDEGLNLTLMNDKTGILEEEELIDFNTIPTSDNSGNYGSEWIDIDNDNDQDLYIAKCRFGVNDPEDPRRHNMLYINNNGTFTNEAEVRGLKNKSQSWTGSFADFDNDGDFDCFISNHDTDHVLMQNDGNGYFIPYPTNVVFNKTFSFQVLLADYDNNGFVDILITGADESDLYLNLDGSSFEKTNLFSDAAFSSATYGDINDDGFMDVQAYYSVSINLPGGKRDELFVNDANENNYAKFTLKGIQSNANGVGAKVTAYSNGGKKTRQVQAGVSYGITNTLTQHFGLGSDNIIDSISVLWPLGIVEKYYDLDVNTHYFLQEGKCISKRFDLLRDKEILCNADSITLSTATQFDSYLWNDNTTKDKLIVKNTSSVSLKAIDENGCEFISNIEVVKSQQLTNDELIIQTADTFYLCKGDSILLNKNEFISEITWPDGSNGNDFLLKEEGSYKIVAEDNCQTNHEKNIEVKYVTDLTSKEIKIKIGRDTTLYAEGKIVEWYSDAERTDLLLIGNNYIASATIDTTHLYISAYNKKGQLTDILGIKNLPTSNQYASDQVDGGLYLNVFENIVLKSFLTRTDKAGIRRIHIISYEGDTIFTKDVMIEKNIDQRIYLDAKIPIGTLYQLKTDQDINLMNLGFEGPRLYRANQNITYPYIANEYAEIPVSTKGAAAYYYFFDIELEIGGVECYDEAEYIIVPDTTTSSNDLIAKSDIVVYPNPASDEIFIKGKNLQSAKILDLKGRQVSYVAINRDEIKINTNNLQSGMYILETTAVDNSKTRQKIIVEKN